MTEIEERFATLSFHFDCTLCCVTMTLDYFHVALATMLLRRYAYYYYYFIISCMISQ